MKFTNKERTDAEMAVRSFSKKAIDAYNGISPLEIYEKMADEIGKRYNYLIPNDDGKRYYIRGAIEYENLTFKEMEKIFEDIYDETHMTDPEMDALVNYMDDDIREKVHQELAPCTHEEFILRYIELDPEFEKVIDQEFSSVLRKLELYK